MWASDSQQKQKHFPFLAFYYSSPPLSFMVFGYEPHAEGNGLLL